MTDMVEHALGWAARGFKVFPLPEGRKFPPPVSWQEMATDDPERVRELWGGRTLNIGVLAEGLIVDVDDKAEKTGSFDWDLLGYPDDTLTVLTPTGGRHLYYATDQAAAQPPLTDSIDIRAAGHGYVLAPGSVTEDGEYILLRDLPVLEAPLALVEHCQERKRIDWEGEVSLDTDEAEALARSYLRDRAPATEGKGGDLWTYKTACGVIDFGISADMACVLMLEEWNGRCVPPWDESELQKKCDSAWKNRLNKVGLKSPEIEFGGIVIPEVPRNQSNAVDQWPEYWAGDPAIDLDQQWLFYMRVPQVGIGMIVGPSNSGKSFLALRLAECLATSEPFFGTEPDERVGTIVLAAEGLGGLKARMKHMPKGLPIVTIGAPSFSDPANIKTAGEMIEARAHLMREKFGARLGVIAIDTWAACGILEDENSNSEISRAMECLKTWVQRFNCLVLIIHHPPKNGSGARGGSALHAGIDVGIEVLHKEGDRIRAVECKKNRDGPIGPWGNFELPAEVVGKESRGRDITTCRVVECEGLQSGIFLDPATADALSEAIGDRTLPYDYRSPIAVTRLIAERVGFEHDTPAGRKQAKAWCDAMIRSNAWETINLKRSNREVLSVRRTKGLGEDFSRSTQL